MDDINISMTSDDPVMLPNIPMYLKNSPGKGRGVYIDQDVPYGTLLHISPLLLFPSETRYSGSSDAGSTSQISSERKILNHYTFTFSHDCQAVALGLGSMFNHSRRNNVGFIIDKENLLIRYSSVKYISKGTELCINYGNHLWFEDSGSDDEVSEEETCNPFSRMEI